MTDERPSTPVHPPSLAESIHWIDEDIYAGEGLQKVREAARRYYLSEPASLEEFRRGFDLLNETFGPTGEIETVEMLERWFLAGSLGAPAGTAAVEVGIRAHYHMVLARDADGSIAGVRDCFVTIDERASAPPEGRAHVLMSHSLVLPAHRRTGVAALLRHVPIALARLQLERSRAGRSGPPPASPPEILLFAEMDQVVPADKITVIRLLAYGKAGFRVVPPSALPFAQPDFRDEVQHGDVEPCPLPFLCVLRQVGADAATHIAPARLRDVVEHALAVHRCHARADHLDVIRDHALHALDAQGPAPVPLIALPSGPKEIALLAPLLRAVTFPLYPRTWRGDEPLADPAEELAALIAMDLGDRGADRPVEPVAGLSGGVQLARSLALMAVLLPVTLGAIEVWERRWAWPVDPAWYGVDESDDTVRVHCQSFAPVRFTPQPAAGVTRILAVGGSTTFGFPDHPAGPDDVAGPGSGFIGAMQGALDARWPGAYELVNLGVNGGNSVDSLRMLRRASHWGARALVIYDGHNEFVTMPAHYSAGMWQFALYRHAMLLASGVRDSPGWVGPAASPSPVHTEAVLDLFRANLHAMMDEAGVPIVIATQASNLSGIDPSWSTSGDARAVASLSGAALQKQWDETPQSADLAWAVGQRLLAAGPVLSAADADAATDALRAAADNDGLTLRATSAVNGVIREVADAHHATLVDAEAAVQAGGAAPGTDLFYDWVHPRPEAARRLGLAMLEGLVMAGVLPEVPEVPLPAADSLAEVRAARSWLQWACVRGHDPTWRLGLARSHARAALALSPDDADAHAVLAIADALEGRPGALPSDPLVVERAAALHPRIAAILGHPSAAAAPD